MSLTALEIEDMKKGASLAFENAERLFKAAVTLEEAKQFPVANSLLILAAEEASKASSIILHATVKEDNKIFKELFEKHEVKIDLIKGHSYIATTLQDMIKIELGPLIKHKKRGGEMTPEVFAELTKKGRENYINSFKDYSGAFRESSWWSNASEEKKDGFYVGYNKGKWKSPSKIKEKQYLKAKKHVSAYLERAKRVCETNIDRTDFEAFKDKFRSYLEKEI